MAFMEWPGKGLNRSALFITLPPAVTDIPHNSKRCKSKVEDAGVHPFGWFFSQLLGGLGANGALGRGHVNGRMQDEECKNEGQYPLFHVHQRFGKGNCFYQNAVRLTGSGIIQFRGSCSVIAHRILSAPLQKLTGYTLPAPVKTPSVTTVS